MLNRIFPKPKPIIAMLHVFDGEREDQLNQALEDLDRLQPHVDGVIVENYGWGYRDSNYATDKTYETLANITSRVVRKSKIPVGVNVLPNDYPRAFRLAGMSGAKFIQLDHITGNFIGHKPVDPDDIIGYRGLFDKIALFGGIHPKYYDLVDPRESIGDAAKTAKPLCDAIVVTGQHTGGETDNVDLLEVKDSVLDHPVIIGSGLNTRNASYQLMIADGAIVGSAFKKEGVRPGSRIDEDLVKELMEEVNRLRNRL